ncbi:MAG: cupin domain-containing protein [Planctomycetes bacterium]|nr:cupin domain-containing protein [Planctomycetota bacterium]
MSCAACLRFVTSSEALVEDLPWGRHEWLSRVGLTEARALQLVRVTMPPGTGHAFHRHPALEEALYYVSGRAEQWVGRERRVLGPGDVAHVPRDEVHGTYNDFREPVVFLAILSPAVFEGPALIDVSRDEPWRSLRAPLGP